MRLHILQHVHFEGPAIIGTWAIDRGHTVTTTALYKDEKLPSLHTFDWLVVMGGPMSVGDTERYGWLAEEKSFIRDAIRARKIVIGVCLGAQLIADALGGRVYPNREKEIGFFPVRLTGQGKASPVFSALPEVFNAFHWHGDTFDLPDGCLLAASSEACANQAFEYDGHVFGLQFHLEATQESVDLLLRHCANELAERPFIQDDRMIRSGTDGLDVLNAAMFLFLDAVAQTAVE